MSDGLNLKINVDIINRYFKLDEFGALIPTRDNLQMEKIQEAVSKQLKAHTGLYRRVTDTYYRTDVEFTDNPFGNTPTIGVGQKRYGGRPLAVKFGEKMDHLKGKSPQLQRRLEKREARIEADQLAYMALHSTLEPTEKDSSAYVQWLVEKEQVMTGGGFDGNSIGEVQKSALKFIYKGATNVEFGSNQFSRLVVEGSLWLKDELKKAGLREGSLTPVGCTEVRMEQDNDGMIGWPVLSKGWSDLTTDIALRLLLESGVDTRSFVGRDVVDPRTGENRHFSVVNAIAYVLDNTIITDPSDVPSIVILLARIQKHAWKQEADGTVHPKKSKTRSVYPNSARAGMIEAMVGTPLIKELQRLKFRGIPSLLDKPSRVEIIKDLITRGHSQGYEFLPLDESQYDATVIGGAFATMLYYAIRPFYNAKYYGWVDFMIYCLVYKYLLTDTALDKISDEDFKLACDSAPHCEAGPFTIFGVTDGLISGAKLTHVGGSCYGLVTLHYVVPKFLEYEPFMGVQGGDDCVLAYPKDRVDLSSGEKTYHPLEEACGKAGLDVNKLKQMWIVVKDEVVVIFLQDDYHESSGTWGVGSIFRPLDAVFFSERNKGLSTAEQFMAEIARMNQGSDSAFAAAGVRKWLEMEQYIGVLFKDYGVSAFSVIVKSIGEDVETIAQRIDVGSFTFGVSKDDMRNGSLPILPIIAQVAKDMTFNVGSAEVLKALGEKPGEVQLDDTEGSIVSNEPDIGDSDDVLAD